MRQAIERGLRAAPARAQGDVEFPGRDLFVGVGVTRLAQGREDQAREAAPGSAPDADLSKTVKRLEASVAENRVVLRAIEQIVEVEEFSAKAKAQVFEAELNELVARYLDQQSLERLAKAQQLASNVLEEQGEISISPKTSLSGNLQALAVVLRQRAAGYRNESAQLLKRRNQIAEAATSSMRGRNYGGF